MIVHLKVNIFPSPRISPISILCSDFLDSCMMYTI
jgi:hypothetical protein